MKTRLIVLALTVILLCIAICACNDVPQGGPTDGTTTPGGDTTTAVPNSTTTNEPSTTTETPSSTTTNEPSTTTETPSTTTETPSTTTGSAHTCNFDKQIATSEYIKSEATCKAKAAYYYSCACGAKGTETFEHGDLKPHVAAADDGDCTTDRMCANCDQVAIEGNESHTAAADDGDCTTARMCVNCDKIAIAGNASHTAAADDGDCTTARMCVNCDKIAIAGNASHTAAADDGDCTTARMCVNCDKIAIAANASHTAAADDGDCTTDRMCVNCDKVAIEGNENHTPEDDDNNCTTPVKCANCDQTATAAKTHNFENQSESQYTAATCQQRAKNYYSCSNPNCNIVSSSADDTYETGNLADHNYIREIPQADRLAAGYTCQTTAKYYKTCEWCNRASGDQSKTFTANQALTNHVYNQKVENNNTFKSEDTSVDGNKYYYFSCVCGAVSTEDYYAVPKNHTHVYDKEVAEAGYSKTAATCADYATYYKSCECGKSSKDGTAGEVGYNTYFEYEAGGKTPHEYDRELTVVGGISTKATDATCETQATYYKSCKCGEVSTTATFSYGEFGACDPEDDDGDCTTPIKCSVCEEITTPAKTHVAEAAHADDCTKDRMCTNANCEQVAVEGNASHTPADDDGDCTTDIICTNCTSVATEGYDSHTGGTATCSKLAECDRCHKEYGDFDSDAHTFDKEVQDDKYLDEETGDYYYSCECGAKGNETFEAASWMGNGAKPDPELGWTGGN
ncbi:MAG: hypothetical protein E7640_01725 [Ruminococcaceae bacterium]|nr:hypothetical protein [Oscillospiraceae bacterium]